MCRMCEGFSLEDVLALEEARIAERGYTLVAVASRGDDMDDATSWVYTAGLLDAAGHPEMIIAGVPTRTAGRVLSALATAVLDGEWFAVGDTIDLGAGSARVGLVHERQYELGTFNMWHNLRSIGALHASELAAVQIILPDELSPFREQSWQPLLADPNARV